jgi:hypothetical protein
MKCIKNSKGEGRRVLDVDAEEFVKDGWSYCNKATWKATKGTVKRIAELPVAELEPVVPVKKAKKPRKTDKVRKSKENKGDGEAGEVNEKTEKTEKTEKIAWLRNYCTLRSAKSPAAINHPSHTPCVLSCLARKPP